MMMPAPPPVNLTPRRCDKTTGSSWRRRPAAVSAGAVGAFTRSRGTRDVHANVGVYGSGRHAAMSTSSALTDSPSSTAADVDERPGPAARPSGRSKDDVAVVRAPAFDPVPGFLSADPSRRPTPTLEAEVKRLQAALNTAARNRPAQRSVRGGKVPPFPGRAAPGATGSGMLTAMLSRPRFATAGIVAASVMIAAVAGTLVYVSLPQGDDWDFADLPPPASPLLPDAATAAAVVNGSEAGLQARPAQPDSVPAESKIEVAALQMAPDSPARPEPVAMAAPERARPEAPVMTAPEPALPARFELPVTTAPEPEEPERAVIMVHGVVSAAPRELAPGPAAAPPPLAVPLSEPPLLAPAVLPEPPVMAALAPSPYASHESFAMAREPVPPARSGPPPEWLAAVRQQPIAGRLLPGPAARASFQFADSNVRYLTSAELQRLSANRLRIARNEIFARKGRLFKDDTLRAYFSQFAWYQPRAWDVPLSPVEVANVSLIQSIEDAAGSAAPTRSIGESVRAETETGTRAAFPDPRREYLIPAELQQLSTEQLVLVRNAIFARKGRYFKDPALRASFEQFPWYQPYAWDVPLSEVERANVDLLQSIEQSRTGRLPPT
jgi:hypothetical protein